MHIARSLLLACLPAATCSAQWYWPPEMSAQVQCGDVVGFAAITVRGTWPDSCRPRRLEASRLPDGAVLLTVYHEYPSGSFCLSVLTPYSLDAEMILPDGDYPVFVALDSTARPDIPPQEIGAIRVRCLPRCIGDFNEDGGVDGADVESFFIAWETAAPDADVNQDGGIDGADVQTFFEAWERGGC